MHVVVSQSVPSLLAQMNVESPSLLTGPTFEYVRRSRTGSLHPPDIQVDRAVRSTLAAAVLVTDRLPPCVE